MKVKAFSMILVLSMLVGLFTPVTAKADDFKDNATGGGSSGSLTTGNGSLHWSPYDSGYRFTIMDKAGNVVSLGEDGKPGSVDVFFFDYTKINTDYYFTNCKTQPLESKVKSNKRLTVDDLKKAAKLDSLPPVPISTNGSGSAQGNGESLKLWLMENQKFINPYKSSSGSSSNTSGSSSGSSEGNGNSSSSNSGSSDNTSGNTSENKSQYNLKEMKQAAIADAEKLKSILAKLTSVDLDIRKKMIDYWMGDKALEYRKLYFSKEITQDFYDSLMETAKEKYDELIIYVTPKPKVFQYGIPEMTKNDTGSVFTASDTVINPLYLSAASDTEKEYEITKILRARYNNKPLFELPEQSQSEFKGMDTIEIMAAQGYLLLIENLTYIQPATWDSAKGRAGVYFPYYVFGTISNYAEAMTMLKNKGLWTDMSGGAYASPTTKLGWSALRLEDSWMGDGLTISAPSETEGTRRPLDELAATNKLSQGRLEGYGMQLYQTNPTEESPVKQINVVYSRSGNTNKLLGVYRVNPNYEKGTYDDKSYTVTLESIYKGGKFNSWKAVAGLNIPINKEMKYYTGTLKGNISTLEIANRISGGQTVIAFYQVDIPEVQLITVVKTIDKKDGAVLNESLKVSKAKDITNELLLDSKKGSYSYTYKQLPSNAENLKSKVVNGLDLKGIDYESLGEGKIFDNIKVTGLKNQQTIVISYEIIKNQTKAKEGRGTGDITLEEDEIAKGIKNVLQTADKDYKLTVNYTGYPANKLDSNGCGQVFSLVGGQYYYTKYQNNIENKNGSLSGLDKELVYAGTEKGSPFLSSRTGISEDKVKAVQGKDTAKEYKPDYDVTVYRGKASDKVTLAKYYYDKKKKDSAYEVLKDYLGLEEANSISTPRAEASGWYVKKYELPEIKFTFTADSVLDLKYKGISQCNIPHNTAHRDTYIDPVKDKDGKIISSGYWTYKEINHGSTPETKITAAMKENNSVKVEVAVNNYLGSSNYGTSNSEDKGEKINFQIDKQEFDNSSLSSAFGYSINTNKSMLFNPYIRMKYSTTNSPTDWNYAYVLSEHQSELKNSDYVDIGYVKGATDSLTLDSNQWNTSKRSIDALGKNNVLPAGAVFTLKADPSNKTYVGLKVWQTFVESDESSVVSNYSYYSKSTVDSRRDSLVGDVKKAINSYDVVQYIAGGILKSTSEVEKQGELLDPKGIYGSPLTRIFGNKVNSNSKYYLQLGGDTTPSSGKIDIVDENSSTITWKIASDVTGKVILYKNGTAYKSITKSESLNDLIGSDTDLKELNSKAKLLSNFLASIDRNAGQNAWYNEAMDGISVQVTSYLYEVGFKTGSSTRSAALDTALAGHLDSKSDMFNYDSKTAKDKVRTSFFKTSPRAAGSSYSAYGSGYLATWGDDKTGIYLTGLDDMLTSRLFYLPNVSVQDLD